MPSKSAALTIQKWGNSLAVRIPSEIARSTHIHLGTVVELTVRNRHIIVSPVDHEPLTLEERLELFDPKKHGGEVMASSRIGAEKF